MSQKNKIEKIYKKHYEDLLDLNKSFIMAIARPRPISAEIQNTGLKMRKKLTKKQLNALARGRKILASKRLKIA